ncbi:MAG: cytochrome-c peroxidase [Bacteroidetes bacterium]|nr:cytochrome-c peroxidase [Bacteroidota bacterium]
MRKYLIFTIVASYLFWNACKKDPKIPPVETYNPTAYQITYPTGVVAPTIPAENPMTVEGIALGRRLFYDVKLSGNNTMSCASCHALEFGMTDNNLEFSKGIDGIFGKRNSMPIFNLAWDKSFFWDGGAPNLESQVVGPLTSPIEMHSNFKDVIYKLSADPVYPNMFFKAFGSDSITSANVMRAIAQFERSIVSYNSTFDQLYKTQKQKEFALRYPVTRIDSGFMIFAIEDTNRVRPGHCWHCHGTTPSSLTFTDYKYHNNGLDDIYQDSGRMRITYNPVDLGYFKTPSLRNLSLTAPYMHDGRFKTLDEVIDHYDSHVIVKANSDPFTKLDFSKPLRFSARDKENLKLFLLSLTDSSLITNNNYKSPF